MLTIPENPPHLILICGPCRSGTSALAKVFIQAGIPSHMQPIKSWRRAEECGDRIVPWHLQSENGPILSKETFGPIHESEFFNPVQMLLNLGYPKEKLTVILMIREPSQVYASWHRMWYSVDMDRFYRSYLLTAEIYEFCQQQGIECLSYAHEVIRDHDPAEVVARLFSRLELSINDGYVSWENGPKFGDQVPENSHVYFYDSPPEKFIEGVREWGGYQYRALSINFDNIPCMSKIDSIYRGFYEKCLQILNL